MDETWTILKVIDWTIGYFKRKNIDQPRANAEVLLAFVLGVERIQLYLNHDKPLAAHELARYREAVQRRAAHEPTQYITQRQEFWSLEFEVNPSSLIPRPETELLVESGLDYLGDRAGLVLDLCTGSGVIAVSLAHERPALRVTATDRSLDAIALASKNANRHHVENRILFAAMDLFNGFSPQMLFDLIITNPPYISESQFRALSPEIVEHEPHMALWGGAPEGLAVINKILRDAPKHLKPGGALIMEIGQGQAELLGPMLAELEFIDSIEFIKDYSGILRVLHLRTKDV